MVAGELVFTVGHKGRLVRPHSSDEGHEVLRGVALDVVFTPRPLLHECGQIMHVVRTDMALIGPRMHGDAIGPSLQTQGGGTHHTGYADMARVAQQGHLVDID